MTTKGPYRYEGGWNTKASALTLPESQYPDALNMQLIYGDANKRKGSATLNSSAFGGGAAITGLAQWQTAAGQRYLIITAGTKIGQMADLGGTFTDMTGAVTITSGQNNQSTFASLNNILVRCGGTTPDAPIKWTGTGNAAALGGSPPSGRICTTVNNFMFISGISATPSRVFWSNVIDPETWGASNFVDFRKDDGDQVQAIAPIGQDLAIFKRNSIGRLFTTPPSSSSSVTLGPLITVPSYVGCVGGLAWDLLPNGFIVFLGPDAHVYVFDGTTVTDISDPEPPASNIQPTLNALPISRLPYAVLRVYPTRSQIWLSISTGSGTANSVVFVYDYVLKIWLSKFDNINANAMTTIIDTRATPSHPVVVITGNYSGTCYEQDTGTSNPEEGNNNIDGYITTCQQLGSDKLGFIPRTALIPMEQQGAYNLEINYGFDALSEVSKSTLTSLLGIGGLLDNFMLDSSVLGGPNMIRRSVLLNSYGTASSIQVQFRNRSGGQSFNIHPFFLSDEVLQ